MSANEADVPQTSSPFLRDLEATEELRQLRLKLQRLQDESQSEIDSGDELRKRVNLLEKEKLKLTTDANEEVNELQALVAKLGAQAERSEAARQQLDYEVVVARRGVSLEKSNAAEREDGLKTIIQSHQDKINELTAKVQDFQTSLVSQRRFADDADARLQDALEEKGREVAAATAERDIIRNEKEQLQQVFQEQENIYAETQEKLVELKTERDTQTNTVRQQLRELQYAAEREERLKKELEVAVARVKSLEETIEAERAAHLESKFNSELVQLQVRDLKGALEVEKSAHSEIEHNADSLAKQLRNLEAGVEGERGIASSAKQEVESLSRENELLKHQLSAETDSKRAIVSNMAIQLDMHQKNFDELKQELSKTKKRQIYLEETYGGSMRELELLLHNFQLNSDKQTSARRSKTKKGGAKKDENLSPMLVLETLRHTLKDYQSRLDFTSQELIKMKTRCEKMTEECEKYKEVTWTRSQTVQDLQKKFTSSCKELEQLRHQLSKSESQVISLRMELQQASHQGEIEGSQAADRMEEYGRRIKNYQDEEEKRRIYLHSLYQRIVAGRSVLDPQEPILSSFTWEELSIAVQDQIVGMMTGLNRANEKVSHLETVIHNKDELLRDIQHSHEENLERLSAKGKHQARDWQQQRVELEEQFIKQHADLQIKSQKSQALAQQAWEKARLTSTVKEGLESECCQLREQLSQVTQERTALLLGCSLLAGTLLPMFSKVSQLAAQRNLLEEQVQRLEVMRQQAKKLASTLAMDGSDLEKDFQDVRPTRNPIMLFRKAVIAVIAANRLSHLGRGSCRIFTAVDNPSGVHSVQVCSGNVKLPPRPFTGLSSSPDKHSCRSYIESHMSEWFTSASLLTAVVDSCSELQVLLSETDPSLQPQVVSTTARSCFIRLMSKLTPLFETSTSLTSGSSYRAKDKSMLVRLLGYGLGQRIATSNRAGQTEVAQDTMACLQRNIITFTQRLHTAEVERRSLRMEAAKLRQENSQLNSAKDRARNMEDELTQLRDTRQSMVMRQKFDSVCQELGKALSRERQAQELLNEQSRQLEELGMRLNLYTTEELEKDATITEAVKSLSDAKMQLRRKEQSIRQLSKQLSALEEEKKSLKDSVADVQGVLRSVNKDKDKLASYLQSIQAAVEETKRQLISRADNRSMDAALRQVLVHPEQRGIDGISAEAIAIKSLVAAFVDAVQTALSRITALEAEITSHKQHIVMLKEEVNAACLRAYPTDEQENVIDAFVRSDPARIPERSFGRLQPLYETDQSYKEQFLPLREEPDFSTRTQDASKLNASLFTPQATPLATSTQRKSPRKGRALNH